MRAPALYCTGRVPGVEGTTVAFRLPCPPLWDDGPPRAWAAQRRARKAYFAALDALATGQVHPEQVAKLRRFCAEVRSTSAHRTLEHLLRVLAFVRRAGERPVVAAPGAPLEAVVLAVPDPEGHASPEALRARYAWALEWMRTRRFVVGKGLAVEWRLVRPSGRGHVLPPTLAGAA